MEPIATTRLKRIAWRCRRGMLENDLVLTRYLERRGEDITEHEVAMLDVLLELPDTELWDIIAGRGEPADASLGPLVTQLRTA